MRNIQETFSSKSSDKIYTCQVTEVGLVGCDCRGWITKREGKPRFCTHCQELVRKYGLTVVERDGQMFVVERGDSRTDVTNRAAVAKIIQLPVARVEPTAFVAPMLASKMPTGKDADEFSADRFVMEEKFDGHRLVVSVSGGQVSAWSRLQNVRTLPAHIESEMAMLPDGIFDGELIVPGMHSYDVVAGQNAGAEVLVLFDALSILGQSITSKSQRERRSYLEVAVSVLDGSSAVKLTTQTKPSMAAVRTIWARGGEGAIIKNLDAPYRPGNRSGDWIKVKAVAAATLTITGFETGENGPFSAVALVDDQGNTTTVKTLNNVTLREVASNPGSFIGRRLVVSYQERTPAGNYRHPMFDHFAGDAE